ncbi:MAG: HNH endonuclease [Candidatus Aenigmatarchaeota archaeon]
MVEKERIFYFSLASLGLLAISFFAFPLELKKQVREQQNNICAMCGRKVKKLQIHHRTPQAFGGQDTIENAIGLCSKCHKIADERAFKMGKYP